MHQSIFIRRCVLCCSVGSGVWLSVRLCVRLTRTAVVYCSNLLSIFDTTGEWDAFTALTHTTQRHTRYTIGTWSCLNYLLMVLWINVWLLYVCVSNCIYSRWSHNWVYLYVFTLYPRARKTSSDSVYKKKEEKREKKKRRSVKIPLLCWPVEEFCPFTNLWREIR